MPSTMNPSVPAPRTTATSAFVSALSSAVFSSSSIDVAYLLDLRVVLRRLAEAPRGSGALPYALEAACGASSNLWIVAVLYGWRAR